MSASIEKTPRAVEAPIPEASDTKDAQFQQPSPEIQQRQKWYQWFAPTDTPAERRLILKLDGLIIVFVFLAYWAKVLDSSATSTAYVSGMREDLKMYGNQLNYLNTVYMYVLRRRFDCQRPNSFKGRVYHDADPLDISGTFRRLGSDRD